MFKKTVVINCALALTIAALAMTAASQSMTNNFKAQAKITKALPGSWEVAGETPAQGQFRALITFTSDGSLIANEPSAFETAGHGSWTTTEANQVAYTFVAFIGSATGEFSGSIKVVGTLQVDATQAKWSGPFRVDVSDPNGNLVFTDSGTLSGSRIQIESLN